MRRNGIATAAYAVCLSMQAVRAELPRFALPVVVKADGVGGGQGRRDLRDARGGGARGRGDVQRAAAGCGGDAGGDRGILVGEEMSFFALCDGSHAVALAAAQDHKRIGEGDTGPNTGGMGAYATDALLSPEMETWLTANVAQRVMDAMAAEGTRFAGVLFCGMMMVPGGDGAVTPMVLEFNTRFGDPETQAMVMGLETDLLDLLVAVVDGTVDRLTIRRKPGAAVCVVAASGGYPGKYASGKVIAGLDEAQAVSQEVKVFHAGSALHADGILVTMGGRVLGITTHSEHGLEEALALAYEAIGKISFEGMQYRRDIGWRALALSTTECDCG